ncbi:Gfo/Idh/MocA family oxidoreductase [Kribbella sandramycini]|uniref:Gfo/Idh/MocA family oxidoreductase n=1 Tax=Kribbella sandramycini TaxID=60450 RepID=A0A7Y4L780_9ACTN|nr:Gfo/Idh/MocA family oxidoreductase [Kribbella sandramycini]MBB6570190.1 putative dehydrogenase [Kribbella sandramycini]NOL45685.1 Gfo/Idh/MocA family oxidoreductase [Kribbella sandramycini]
MSNTVRFAAVGLDHAHIHGQVAGLIAAGAEFVAMATDDWSAAIAQQVRERYPDVPVVEDVDELISTDGIDLIVTAGVPDRRGPIAVAALRAGKDVVTDKPGCVSFAQLEEIEKAVAESGRFWSVTFSERFEVRCAIKAGELVRAGRIGTVVQTLGLGPHRVGDRGHLGGGAGRPDWFYDKSRYGGILVDIASHQIDQFLWYTGSRTAEVVASSVGNFANPETPGLQDFGDLLLRSESAQGYVRVDWYTPAGLPTWGDGRLMILGTDGYIELRKYVDIEGRPGGDHLFIADQDGTHYVDCSDVELTYYDDLVRDVQERTSTAAPQEHTFETTRLALTAQQQAVIRGAAE